MRAPSTGSEASSVQEALPWACPGLAPWSHCHPLGFAPDLGGAVLVADADDRDARALRQLDERRDAALPHPRPKQLL